MTVTINNSTIKFDIKYAELSLYCCKSLAVLAIESRPELDDPKPSIKDIKLVLVVSYISFINGARLLFTESPEV